MTPSTSKMTASNSRRSMEGTSAGCHPPPPRTSAGRSRSVNRGFGRDTCRGGDRRLRGGPRAERGTRGRVDDGEQIAGVGELGHERRVEAHEVDRGVVGGQPPDELFALRVGVIGPDLGLDAVGPVRRFGALGGQGGLAPVVEVRLPDEGGHAGVVTAAADERGGADEHRDECRCGPVPPTAPRLRHLPPYPSIKGASSTDGNGCPRSWAGSTRAATRRSLRRAMFSRGRGVGLGGRRCRSWWWGVGRVCGGSSSGCGSRRGIGRWHSRWGRRRCVR